MQSYVRPSGDWRRSRRGGSACRRSTFSGILGARVSRLREIQLAERPPKRLPKASHREAPFENKLWKTNDPSLSNTWPLKGFTIQSHSTVNEFCSRLGELREKTQALLEAAFSRERPPNALRMNVRLNAPLVPREIPQQANFVAAVGVKRKLLPA